MLKNYSNPDYKSREGRNAYCIKLIDEFFSDTKTILNLGGGGSRYFKDTKYKVTEVDQSGDNNITLDLDNVEKIPFESNSFDTVICLDVLEHLENFHLILDEMNRVSEKYIIISLPNCVHAFFEILFDKRSKNQFENGYYNKFYGLPLNNHISQTKKLKSIYVGGLLQTLFGIKGKRFDEREEYKRHYNKHWIYSNEKPKNCGQIEDGCYWE